MRHLARQLDRLTRRLAARLACELLHRQLRALAFDRMARRWVRLCPVCDAGHSAIAPPTASPAAPTVERAAVVWRIG